MSSHFSRLTGVIGAGLSAILSLGFADAARADDNNLGATPGVFLAIPANSMTVEQAKVQINGRQVMLSLSLHGNMPEKSSLLLKGELFGWLGESETYPDRHFPELKITSNPPIQPNDSFAAYVGNTDISSLLVEASINPWLIADTPPFVPIANIKPELLAKLQSVGALKTHGADYLAQWRAQRLLKIDPQPEQTIALAYDLRPAYSLQRKSALTSAALRKRYCFSQQQLDRALTGAKANTEYLAKEITIPLSVDHHPPKLLRFSIKPESDVVFVASCSQQGSAVAGAEGLTDVVAKTDRHGNLTIFTIARIANAAKATKAAQQ